MTLLFFFVIVKFFGRWIVNDKRVKWKSELWPIEKLKAYSKNPRIITESGINQLKSSFDEIGYAQPININTDGTILSGHARYRVLQEEGAEQVEVLVPDRQLTPKQEEAVVIRMNKNIAGQFDFDILANEFDLGDLMEWGFTEKELQVSTEDFGDESDPGIEGDSGSKLFLEVEFTNDTDRMAIYNDLLNQGYVVRIK